MINEAQALTDASVNDEASACIVHYEPSRRVVVRSYQVSDHEAKLSARPQAAARADGPGDKGMHAMPLLTRLGAIILAFVVLTACGEGYVVEPARLNLLNATAESKNTLTRAVSGFLAQEEFEDLGRDDEMIALLKSNGSLGDDPIVERLSREHTYLHEARGLRVVLSDYSDGAREPDGDYTPKTPNFVEIRISESRPGGASPAGHRFFQRFHSVMKRQFGDDIVVVNGPPATDDIEYGRVTRVNQVTTVVWWCIALLVSLLITAPISRYLLGRTRLALLPKRAVFTAVNTWLVTPVLMPASIMVVLVPNAFAFPWVYHELYSYRAAFHLVSFVCAFIVCAAASVLFVRDTHNSQRTSA